VIHRRARVALQVACLDIFGEHAKGVPWSPRITPDVCAFLRSAQRALSYGFLPAASAATAGALFVLSRAPQWLAAVGVTVACIVTALDKRNIMNKANTRTFSLWEQIEAPAIVECGARHGLNVSAVVSVPQHGAFWIATGSKRGIVALGTGIDDQHLPAVLAHEFGHGALDHLAVRCRMQVQAVALAFAPVLLVPAGRFVTGAASAVACVAALWWNANTCRRQELEADAYAADVVGPDAVIAMLDSLANQEKEREVFAAHPAASTRVAALKGVVV
jgi:Zn-dependent protease with chaperone function